MILMPEKIRGAKLGAIVNGWPGYDQSVRLQAGSATPVHARSGYGFSAFAPSGDTATRA